MELSNLINLKPYRNLSATFYALFILIFLISIIMFEYYFNNLNRSTVVSLFNTFYIILWILILLSIIWTYKIAKRTGRNSGLWVFLGLIFGPIPLLFISLMDYKIDNPMILNIIYQIRKDYKNEINNKSGFESAQAIENKYNVILKEEVAKIFTIEKVSALKELIDIGVIDNNVDIKDKERIIGIIEHNKLNDSETINWTQEWNNNENLCPACGQQIDKESTFCLNCGLRVK